MPTRKYMGSDPLDDIPTRPARIARRPRTANKRTTDRIRSTSGKSPKPKPTETPKPPTTESLSEPKPTETPKPSTREWEASNIRVTFYCPKTLLGKVEHEIVRSRRSKTRVIVDAIEHHLSSGKPASKAKAE